MPDICPCGGGTGIAGSTCVGGGNGNLLAAVAFGVTLPNEGGTAKPEEPTNAVVGNADGWTKLLAGGCIICPPVAVAPFWSSSTSLWWTTQLEKYFAKIHFQLSKNLLHCTKQITYMSDTSLNLRFAVSILRLDGFDIVKIPQVAPGNMLNSFVKSTNFDFQIAANFTEVHNYHSNFVLFHHDQFVFVDKHSGANFLWEIHVIFGLFFVNYRCLLLKITLFIQSMFVTNPANVDYF